VVSPQAKREAVAVLMTERYFGVTRACGMAVFPDRYIATAAGVPRAPGLRERIGGFAAVKRRYEYRRVYLS